MDFADSAMEDIGGLICGRYERLEPHLLPQLYVAYRVESSEPGEVFHNNLRARFDNGETEVVEAMRHFAQLAETGREALLAGRPDELTRLIDDNFDTRCSICQLPPQQIAMVELAREAGASAKFAGSGGAIIGAYQNQSMFDLLRSKLEAFGCRVLRPQIA